MQQKIGHDYNENTTKAAREFARAVMDSECSPNNEAKKQDAKRALFRFQAAYFNQFKQTPSIMICQYWREYHGAEDDISFL